ncbi:hypothetical protein CXF80_11450 [Shewanella sp. Actino-trap-3]|nr:hypothetical protein CXF80_11450 [Shewanella sp. Actino-trap-3]
MGSMTTSKNGILSASEGSVTITINNETKELQLGQTAPAGAIVASSDELGFVITLMTVLFLIVLILLMMNHS